MDAGALLGTVGIVATASFGVWAINDARKQVRQLIRTERNLAWVRIQNDLVWLFVEPTEKAHSKEIAKGLGEYAVLARELDPRKTPEDLKNAAEREALEMAEKLVAEGYARWKNEMDMKRVRKSLDEWKAQKSDVRTQNPRLGQRKRFLFFSF